MHNKIILLIIILLTAVGIALAETGYFDGSGSWVTTTVVSSTSINWDDTIAVTTNNPVLNFSCNNGDQSYSCASYTTTTATKKGTIKVKINGSNRFIPFYETPN